jgi:hypothetical protein
MSWTFAICDDCWAKERPLEQKPHRLVEEYRETEVCCRCGKETRNGLYIRTDPKEVKYGH